jgi:hypothetical protein
MKGTIMRFASATLVASICLGLGVFGVCPSALAQTIDGAPSLALKNGESVEVGPIYWVSQCKSILKSTPEVEILEGPPGLQAVIKESMVLPRRQHCASKVPGGLLVISAKDIEDPSYTNLTLRITYKTRDGDRKFSHVLNLSLIP